GIRNADNITATYSTTATSASPVGTYPITPAVSDNGTGALVNYTVSLNNGTLTITPAPLTVTAASTSMIYGDPVPALSGTITGIKNADNITATYSTTATSTSPVGTYPITPTVVATPAVLANYTVTIVNGTLTINPAPLTVTAANASMIYGDPVPALSGTITGIKNADNITATYSTTATSTSPVGTYPITPTLSDNATGALANYTVTSNNGTLTINPAPLSVTAANASMIYGDPLPVFSGTITGIRNADNITATYSTTATSASPVGTYPITPTLSDNATGALANYTVTSTNGTLTITPAPLTVTAANATMVFGDPVPTLTGTVTGIKNADNITGVYTTTATSTSPVGTYPITAAASDNATGALANYTVTLVNATLTITPAPLTATATSTSMVFGDPVPAVTGTLTGVKNGNNITASFSTTATSTTGVGGVPIVPAVSDNGTGALANYTVTLVNGTLTINPAPLTVTATSTSMVYGDPVPAVTGTLTGVKNGDNITASFSTTATSTTGVGGVPIVGAVTDNATGALANYTVTINNGTLTINPAPLSVTAANASMVYGSAVPALSGTITGIKNADNITATYSTTATAASLVGTYPITPALSDNGTGKLANYTVTVNNGTLTVTPAPLTIQAADATAPVGGPFPTFTGTITGAVNGDVITATYSTTATLTSPAGTYPIIPTPDPNPALSNYSVTLINGTLTLTAAPAVAASTLVSTGTTTDLQVTGSASHGSVTVPGSDTFTWQIKDNQSTQANNVVFTSDLPAGIEFNAVSTTLGSCSGPAVGTSGTITCTVSTLAGSGSFTVTVDVTVAAKGTFNTTGSVSFDGTDTNTGNNSTTVKISGQ
ncbi:MAG TPA: MBG domain-containing protein, partial [Candidatus Limnocylindrales bacterium]|nr:MBG domain-containing protein [Candidatus Limnocylindrales bacterium]